MLRKRIAESLTARIFLITAGVLLAAGAITFSFIAWASPSTYTAVVNDDLTAQVDTLAVSYTHLLPQRGRRLGISQPAAAIIDILTF